MQVSSSVDRLAASPHVIATESAERALAVENDLEERNGNGTAIDRGNQFQILSEWALSAELNRRVAMTEHTEQAIRRIYAQIESIRRELSMATNADISTEQSSHVARELWQIDSSVATGALGINAQLSLSQSSQSTARLSEQMDLLSPRNQGERLQILMGRSGRAVNVLIPPGQGSSETFNELQSQFNRHGVTLSQTNSGQLAFSVPQENSQILQEPWSFVGNGVRVAAGNPVTIELEQQQSEMRQILESVRSNAARENYINELEARQQRLRATLSELRNERNDLLNQLRQLEMNTLDTHAASQVSHSVNNQMLSGTANQMPLIMAQSGVHVGLVRYGLS